VNVEEVKFGEVEGLDVVSFLEVEVDVEVDVEVEAEVQKMEDDSRGF
jgi:hypothetical protein